MKTLTLVTLSNTRPPKEQLVRMEQADQYPRATLFGDVLCTDLLDARYLEGIPGLRGKLLRRLPGPAAQILEAYHVRKKYDAIIAWSEALGMPLALLMKLTFQRVPNVAIWSWISKPKKARLLKRVYSHIDTIILMSSIQYRFALDSIGIPGSRVALLKWPIDQKFWRPMNVPTDMICTVGREMRDFGTLIEAVKELDIRCHIAAGAVQGKIDPWMEDVRKAEGLHKNISIGKKNYSELRDLYARSRFVVVPLFPTDTDNGTTTILEAMAMGKAVICTRVKGQADVIVEGKTGLFVPPQDPGALREAIRYLWENPDAAEKMGAEGRRVIEESHTVDHWLEQIRGIVQEAIHHHRGNGR